jgi:hypothetical protein
MVKLGREIVRVLVEEYGSDEFVRRISDPVWFQSLGTVLAFDWNASGLTTILTAALKEAIRGEEMRLGVFICGGKGKTSLKTPDDITKWGDRLGLSGGVVSNLTYNSKMAAKVDSALVQDGFDLYHHAFFFSRSGAWAVVQQGMNKELQTARRYHWYSENIKDLVSEPHSAIVSEDTTAALNLVAKKSELTREMSIELVQSGYTSVMRDIQVLRRHASSLSQMVTVGNKQGQLFTMLNLEDREFHTHPVQLESFSKSKYLEKVLHTVTEQQPKNYEALLATPGVGGKTMRALALVGEVIYGASPSYEDPARYSFAFGGKDATPYPVDRRTYDDVISILRKAVWRSQIPLLEKQKIERRLVG